MDQRIKYPLTSLGFQILNNLINVYMSLKAPMIENFSEIISFAQNLLIQNPNVQLKISLLELISSFFSRFAINHQMLSQLILALGSYKMIYQDLLICFFLLRNNNNNHNLNNVDNSNQRREFIQIESFQVSQIELTSKNQLQLIKMIKKLIHTFSKEQIIKNLSYLTNLLFSILNPNISIREIESNDPSFEFRQEINFISLSEMIEIAPQTPGIKIFILKDEINYIQEITNILFYFVDIAKDLFKEFYPKLYEFADILIHNEHKIFDLISIGAKIIQNILPYIVKFQIITNMEIISMILDILDNNYQNSELINNLILTLNQCFHLGGNTHSLYLEIPNINYLMVKETNSLFDDTIETDFEINDNLSQIFNRSENRIEPLLTNIQSFIQDGLRTQIKNDFIYLTPLVPIELYTKCFELIPHIAQSALERYKLKETIQNKFNVINMDDKEYFDEINLIFSLEKLMKKVFRVIMLTFLDEQQNEQLTQFFETFNSLLPDPILGILGSRGILEMSLIMHNNDFLTLLTHYFGETIFEFRAIFENQENNNININLYENRTSILFDQLYEMLTDVTNPELINNILNFYFQFLDDFQIALDNYELILNKAAIGIAYILLFRFSTFPDINTYNNVLYRFLEECLPLQELQDISYEPIFSLLINLIESRYHLAFPQLNNFSIVSFLLPPLIQNNGCHSNTFRRLIRAIKIFYSENAGRKDPFKLFNEEMNHLSQDLRKMIWNSEFSNLPPRKTTPYFQ